ncbi:hypothetical protein A1O3_00282 [Capronia epimyces CBS 606.96]|uniref:Uncharacterized protein n=1 Tax=Capronia epimyces CBS 606.96 TaxID=1182542 RepID=W9YFR1_9EURO|nr:uncharacterized protein A1O3_00282 [Capronia epimyces CBS 606.96]EXJ91732.1 hypothetical protein A1O3_00282 [Capronia epimyces CBS 606.96]
MAMIRGTMTSPDGNTVYATCDHHKVNVPVRQEHLAWREEMRREFRARGGRGWLDEEVMGVRKQTQTRTQGSTTPTLTPTLRSETGIGESRSGKPIEPEMEQGNGNENENENGRKAKL